MSSPQKKKVFTRNSGWYNTKVRKKKKIFGGLTPAPKTPGVPQLGLVIFKNGGAFQGLHKFIADKKGPLSLEHLACFFSVLPALKKNKQMD